MVNKKIITDFNLKQSINNYNNNNVVTEVFSVPSKKKNILKLTTSNKKNSSLRQQHNLTNKFIKNYTYLNKKSQDNKRRLDIRSQWPNSIYTFNTNLLKDTPTLYNIVYLLIKNYFNISNYKLLNKIGIFVRKRKTRLTVNKVFVNKPVIKYTNDLININIFIYNRIRFCLYHRLKKLDILNSQIINKKIKNNIFKSIKEKNGTNIVERPWFNINLDDYNEFYQYSLQTFKQFNKLYSTNKNKMLKQKDIEMFNIHRKKLDILFVNSFFFEKKLIFYYKHVLLINKLLSDNTFLLKISKLIGTVFNKNIKLNIFNLIYPYMGLDIFAEIISIKDRLRRYNFKTILRRAFLNVRNLKKSSRFFFKNKVKWIKQMDFNKQKISKTIASNTLLHDKIENFQIYLNNLFIISKNLKKHPFTHDVERYLLFNTKYKYITGVRLKATGRITRRLVAARSISKLEHRGAIRDFESSSLRLHSPTVIGYNKSNVQYLNFTSTNRIGSYGIKGWFGTQ